MLEIFSYFKSIMVNKIKLLVGFLLVAAGIAAFYLLVDKPMIVRIFAVLAGLGAAVAVFWTTPAGQRLFVFMGESVAEARKVVWPTRKETIQTTMAVSYTHLDVYKRQALIGFIPICAAFTVMKRARQGGTTWYLIKWRCRMYSTNCKVSKRLIMKRTP